MNIGDIAALVHFAGLLASLLFVCRLRAGISLGGRMSAEFIIYNLPWFLLTILKSFVWEAVLVVWLIQGRPPSPWKVVDRGGKLAIRRVKTTAENESEANTESVA